MQVVPVMSFIAKGSSPESYFAIPCHVSLVAFKMEQYLSLNLTFMTLTPLKIVGQLFWSVFQFWFICCFIMIKFRFCNFNSNTIEVMKRSHCISSSDTHLQSADDINFDPLIKMVCVRLPHCKTILFLLIINKYVVRRYFEAL